MEMEESKQQQEDSYLFILLGLDILCSINLSRLTLNKANLGLEIVFSHLTHKQPPPDDGSSYPLGMGLFFHDSKLHFFGGEYLEDGRPEVTYNNKFDIDLLYERPGNCIDKWLNKKVFSFTPILNDNNITPEVPDNNSDKSLRHFQLDRTNNRLRMIRDNSTPLPNHLYYKVRPIVFTISNKLYTLTTQPYSTSLLGKPRLFEVFDIKNGEWRMLPNPPHLLYKEILRRGEINRLTIYHCVGNDKLLLQTLFGQYLFDTIAEKWKIIKKNHYYPRIYAYLEYKDLLLAFASLESSYELVAYDLATFGNESSSTNYIYVLDIFKEKKRKLMGILGASLCLVENNCVCFVANSLLRLHVYLLEVIVESNSIHANVHALKKFEIPYFFFNDAYILSTFVFKPDVKADPREENAGESNQSRNGESKSVFVRSLPSTVTAFDIRQLFQLLKFGEIKPNGVFLNCKERYAFVEFEDGQSINEAIKASPIQFAGKKVYIENVCKASPSRSLWWRKQSRKALKGKVSKMEANCPS